MRDKLLLGLVVGMLGACASDQTPNSPEGPTAPKASEETQNERWQALPGIGTPTEDHANCWLPEADWQGYEPNLDAWVSVSESIFVGTIAAVTKVEAPARHLHQPVDSVRSDIGVIAKEDCTGTFYHAVRFDFVDVETIHGEPVGQNLTIQMGADAAHSLHVVYPEGQNELIDYNGDPAYRVGARVGASLLTRADGSKIWNFRQFQVHEGNVYLQEIDHNYYYCNDRPYVLGIPDSYEGVLYEDFLAAVQQAGTTPNISPDMIQLRDFWFQWYPEYLANPINLVTYQPHCATMEAFDQDPSVPNDPNL